MTKVDPRVRRTHRALQEAMLHLITTKPYETITIQEITERADLNRATFYLHYSSKEDLLADGLESHFDAVVARIMATGVNRPYWEDATAVRIVFEYIAEHHEMYKALLGEKGLGHVIHRILHYLAVFDGVTLAKYLPAGVEPVVPVPVLAQLTAGSFFALARWWLEDGMRYTPAEMAEMMRQMCEKGLRGIILGGVAA